MFKGKIKGIAKAASKTFGPKAASSEGAASSAPANMSGKRGGFAKLFRSPQFTEAVQRAIQKQPAAEAAPAAKKRGMGLFGKVVKATKAAMPAKKMKSGGMADKAGRAMKKTAADAKGRAMKKGK